MNFYKKYLKYKSKYKYLKMMGGVGYSIDTKIIHTVTVNISQLSGKKSTHVLNFTKDELLNTNYNDPRQTVRLDEGLIVDLESAYTYNFIAKLVKDTDFCELYEQYDYKLMQGSEVIFDSTKYTVEKIMLDGDNVIIISSNEEPWPKKPLTINFSIGNMTPLFLPIVTFYDKDGNIPIKILYQELNNKCLIQEGDVFKLNLKNGLFELFKFLIQKYTTFTLCITAPFALSINDGTGPYDDPVEINIEYKKNKEGINEYGVTTYFNDDMFKTDISFFNNFIIKLRNRSKFYPTHLYIFTLDDDDFIQSAKIKIYRY